MPDGSTALRFEMAALAAFDLFIIQRPGARASYSIEVYERAKEYYDALTEEAKKLLVKNIIAGLPGADDGYTIEQFRGVLANYQEMDAAKLRQHLIDFQAAIAPVAEESGVVLAIHPDDPPFPLLGLPRVVSTAADLEALFEAVPNAANGLCFCTGSFGVRADNDLPGMVRQFSDRIKLYTSPRHAKG